MSTDGLTWRGVPQRVELLYNLAADPARAALRKCAGCPCDVYYDYATGCTWELPFPPAGDTWLPVKRASFLKPVADAFAAVQTPLGGPHPLAATIAGGLIGAGLGYGGGALAEQLLPEAQFERGQLRRSLAALGGMAGTFPGLAWGSVNMQRPQDTGGGWRAWVSQFPFANKQANWGYGGDFDNEGGALYLPSIPKDAFNQAIWSDVVQPPNLFGTKSPWGTNEQSLGTPAPVAATVSGIVSGAAAATGQDSVSPLQVALTAAGTAGKGYLAGLAFGKTLGVMAGLRPEAQEQLKQIGLWGGMLSGAVDSLFGR